jgi:hypothetical protein
MHVDHLLSPKEYVIIRRTHYISHRFTSHFQKLQARMETEKHIKNTLFLRLLSSGMWCHVVWQAVTNVSGEAAASIFRGIVNEDWYKMNGME